MVVPPDVNVVDAVMLVAPAESMLAASILIVATPPVVIAEADAGANVTRLLVAANVTTAPDTRFPLASLRVAAAVTGVPNDTVLEERVKTREA